MLFVSVSFVVLFLVVYLARWTLPVRWRLYALLAGGLVFYGNASIPFALHLVLFVAFNHAVIELWRVRPWRWLFISLQLLNVANIAVFKYYYLFFDALGRIVGVAAWMSPSLRMMERMEGQEMLLPLGISFYTFQIMSYGFDVYRGRFQNRVRFVDLLSYAVFFPVVTAGPIMRAGEFLPQLQGLKDEKVLDASTFRRSLWLLVGGLIKKVLIADRLAPVIFPFISGHVEGMSMPQAWLLAIATSCMLYLDFSALSDLARGIGLLLGFEIPINFRAPFFMNSVSDFWRRWHLTFSRWIKDYIYIPLGGSRVSEPRHYLNLAITFTIGGLWHGASYNFILWGLMMGVWLSIEAFGFKRGWKEWPDHWAGRSLRVALSYFVIFSSAVLFFTPELPQAIQVARRMFSFDLMSDGSRGLPGGPLIAAGLLGTVFFHSIEQWPDRFNRLRRYDAWLLPLALVLLIALMIQYAGGGRDFFYQQF